MKKLFAIMFAATASFLTFNFSNAQADVVTPAQPEQVLSVYCCDANYVHRCIINPSPVGSGCYCNYQGNGFVCL